ncbi:MAG: WD40 repeat domain-containing protein [Solirubrobacteraceae bacterium]
MIDSDLRDRLRSVEPDSDPAVEERAWAAIRVAHAAATARGTHSARKRRRWRMTLPAVAALLALAAGTLAVASPRHVAFGRWLREAIGLGAAPQPRPLLAGLPGGGALLVNTPGGPWVVSPDGHRRHLGAYSAAVWSPHSLYVAAWRGARLDILTPGGRQQWTLTAAHAISVVRWSPDGYRIVYLSGRGLRVVAGDGTGDHPLATSAAAAPAWEPHTAAAHRIAVIGRSGELRLLDADSGATIWHVWAGGPARQLLWSSDGTRLAVVGSHRIDLYDARGRPIAVEMPARGQTIEHAAFAPRGDRIALVIGHTAPAGAAVTVLTATRHGFGGPTVLFNTRGLLAGLNWSPDGLWLLASSPSADQWIFIRTRSPGAPEAVSRIAAQFGPHDHVPGFPSLGGWQAPPPKAG